MRDRRYSRFSGSQRGSTRIVLLVVIAIIGILASLAAVRIYWVNKAIIVDSHGLPPEQITVNNLWTAWKLYLDEYETFPASVGGDADGSELDTTVRKILNGKDTSVNKRGIPFFDFPSSLSQINQNNKFVDRWENRFRFKLDQNDDDMIRVPHQGGTNIRRKAVVWSLGPDEENATEDDITSW